MMDYSSVVLHNILVYLLCAFVLVGVYFTLRAPQTLSPAEQIRYKLFSLLLYILRGLLVSIIVFGAIYLGFLYTGRDTRGTQALISAVPLGVVFFPMALKPLISTVRDTLGFLLNSR